MIDVACWNAGKNDISWHFAIRHQVFVEEQGVMVFTDVDDRDSDPVTIHVVAAHGQRAAGTVRLYAVDENGLWKGDRLAVLPAHRSSIVGAQLVRYAVATAATAGGTVMDAHVQVQNTRFFERLGWSRSGDVTPYHGLPHQPMSIDLPGKTMTSNLRRGPTELHLPVPDSATSPLLVGA